MEGSGAHKASRRYRLARRTRPHAVGQDNMQAGEYPSRDSG